MKTFGPCDEYAKDSRYQYGIQYHDVIVSLCKTVEAARNEYEEWMDAARRRGEEFPSVYALRFPEGKNAAETDPREAVILEAIVKGE